MALLIKNAKRAENLWQLLSIENTGETLAPVPSLPSGDVLVSLPLWQAARAALIARPSGRLGVCLAPADDPAQIAEDFEVFSLIAVEFPQFTDGRGYSIGRLLRERYGWRGELRAMGDVQRDQLYYLAQCGFDAFLLRTTTTQDEDRALQVALTAAADFSEAYQNSVARPQPLFRRRPLNPTAAA